MAVVPAPSYEADLATTIYEGLRLFRVDVRRRRVVLKPNLVEHDPGGAINTHPAVVAGAIDAFHRLGAREVIVAEAPGNRRDNEYLLRSSGLLDVCRARDVRYVDLNVDDVRCVPTASRFTTLGHLYLPTTVLEADLLVSMPKLKTHHWAGVTLSMKNMFGVMPGAIYGWPKNLLHWAGISGSVIDINTTLDMPRFAIVDGIVGMEGDGPINGQPRTVGALILGDDAVAVDATAARLMHLVPEKVGYLAQAGRFLGNLDAGRIAQIGAAPDAFAQPFAVIPRFKRLTSG